MRRVLVLGWDAGSPSIAFGTLRKELPALDRMISEGWAGRLRSCHPPVTVPAWQVMVTGADPGELGLYGFRERSTNSCSRFSLANSEQVRIPRLWDDMAARGRSSILSGIPPSYPVYPVQGCMIPCHLTPEDAQPRSYPDSLMREINARVGTYPFDVEFRAEDRDRIQTEILGMTNVHFQTLEFLLKEKKWEFAMHVEIGLDRIQHAFWRDFDSTHPAYRPGSPYGDVIPEYYRRLDSWLGRFMDSVDRDTLIVVASDHGAKAMHGCFCVNTWLEREGLLVLRGRPRPGDAMTDNIVDWRRTKAWAWGGYCSRIFFNVKGRERNGIVEPEDLPAEVERLKEKAAAVTGPDGQKWKTRAVTPAECYRKVRGNPADLMVYWDDLSWRAAGTLGWRRTHLDSNDTGPDHAVHDWDGLFVAWRKNGTPEIDTTHLELADVRKVALDYLE